ncbi:GtrA family protein [Demequina capsici]|uniref:GtrA family protein n=1 Tax=Demequina capsici TaxID=3075620 RepID=A0AA96FFY3_9MICO|nr:MULTISPECIES: GtrA family protein [unclassified Demequina]WNM25867.1 GtrA family protein [Demequina sp. OYTSA14]WNM28762.1 GtrA family protein [Demequina sp. PMTSA13]
MWVLIPAYEPDERLVELVRALAPVAPVVVVDDGSGPSYGEVFTVVEALGATLLTHPANKGKAAALRTGMSWLHDSHPSQDVVCADADGQHRPDDILRVAAELARQRHDDRPAGIVLGARAFDGPVPLRSRLGNRATSALVAAATGAELTDTQTGLRAYPAALIPWAISVRGERFSYELRLLLAAGRAGIPLEEVPISTVYLDGNSSSHFRPVRDSALVLWPLAAFAASSLLAFAFDTAVLLLASASGLSLGLSLLLARTSSGLVNFTINRRTVFRAEGPALPQLLRYLAVAVVVLAAGYGSLRLLTWVGLPLIVAKVITDGCLWVGSYGAQRLLVFRPHHARDRHRAHRSAAHA